MAKDTICGRSETELIESIDRECELRGHTRSEAVDLILQLGLPIYLKKFSKKYQLITKGEAARDVA